MNKSIVRIIAFVLGMILLFALFACETVEKPTNDAAKTDSSNTSSGNNGTSNADLSGTSKSIIVYFSRTNNTERIAEFIVGLTDSDSYEILAKVPYTDANINYNNSNSRANREQSDSTARPEIGSETIDLSAYDVIYLGYPIWHGQAPKIMYTFVESYDLSGKTIVPFCTSASSGIGSSATNLSSSAPTATWLTGKRFSSSSSKSEVSTWLSGLQIQQADNSEQTNTEGTNMGKKLHLYINDTEVSVDWKNNDSVNALIALVSTDPLTVQMSMYGGFEQVGSLGTSLPRNDKQATTDAGDIVLYSGNQIVIFYGTNTWSYTRLGKITDKSASELRSLLGNGNVKITISYEE